jgi:hypothetical protein
MHLQATWHKDGLSNPPKNKLGLQPDSYVHKSNYLPKCIPHFNMLGRIDLHWLRIRAILGKLHHDVPAIHITPYAKQ